MAVPKKGVAHQRALLQKRAQIISTEETARRAKVKVAALKAELAQMRKGRG